MTTVFVQPRFSEMREVSLEGCVEKAVAWLFRSGIYVLESKDPFCGAVYSHYSALRKRHEVTYAEATGYAISLIGYRYMTQHQDCLVRHALASGGWLVRWAERNSGIVSMGLHQGREIRQAYAFDNGICCRGLIDLYQMSGDKIYLDCAVRIAEWLINDAVNSDGSVKPIFVLDSGRFIEDRRLWYKASGSFHAKIAMPLLLLHRITGDVRFADAAMRIYDWAIAQQLPDGAFPASKYVPDVNVHFHCYTVEALLYAYATLGSEHFVSAAERAARWVIDIQRQDGHVPRWYGRGRLRDRAADVQAQVLRILCLLHMLRPRKELAVAIDLALRSLLGLQAHDNDVRLEGGFFEGDLRKHYLFLKRSDRMMSWATMFAIQALMVADKLSTGDFGREAKSLF